LRLFSGGAAAAGGGRDDDDVNDAWRYVVFPNATPKEEEEEEEEKEEEEKDIARVVSIFAQKFLTRKKLQRRKKGKKRETLHLGFRVYLEKEKKGDSATLSSKNKKILQILFARTTRTDTSTPIFNKTRTKWHRFAYVRCFRSRREREETVARFASSSFLSRSPVFLRF